jgi:putative transposase
VRRHSGGFAKEVARGLAVRHDHGSQYMARDFQKELRFLGVESSPAFVRAPEGNGCAERFIRTLKENLLWVRSFATVEELRRALLAFREAYDTTWLIERQGFRRPAAIREEQLPAAALAA